MKKAKTTKRSKYASQIDLELLDRSQLEIKQAIRATNEHLARLTRSTDSLAARSSNSEDHIVRLAGRVQNLSDRVGVPGIARDSSKILRRQIAAHMLQGMLASGDHCRPPLSPPAVLAQMAYTLADALIAEGRE